MSLAKNQKHIVTIHGYTSEGAGVARIDGQVIFVPGALDGEECLVQILRAEKRYAYAKVLHIEKSSSARKEIDCPYYPKCGGCDLRHMTYEEELRFKQSRITDAIERIGGLDVSACTIVPADQIKHYRNKAIFAVGQEGAGFYRKRTHEIVPISTCRIQDEKSTEILRIFHSWMRENQISIYNEQTNRGSLRHLYIRTSRRASALAVCLVVGEKPEKLDALIHALRRECPFVSGVGLIINRTCNNTILRGDLSTLWGSVTLEDTLCGLSFRLSPLSFFQVNLAQTEKLYRLTQEAAALTGKETILDLYCGTGTIGLSMASIAKQVIGADVVPAAIEDAKENARRNAINNAHFLCLDAAAALTQLQTESLHPDVVILDPPRRGLSVEAVELVASACPERIVYVSCNPATLARDLGLFRNCGYNTLKITPLDLFPRTAHVEAVASLQRQRV